MIVNSTIINKLFLNDSNNNTNNNIEENSFDNIKITSKKPLWIGDVKKSIDNYFPNDSKNMIDLEEIKNLMYKEKNNVIDENEYPYYNTVRKIMYSYGDTYECNSDTVIYMCDFIKNFLKNLNKIIIECEFKKIIEHLFGYEYEKFHSYKKINLKNNFIIGENENKNIELDEELEFSEISKDKENTNQNKNTKKNKDKNSNDDINNFDNIVDFDDMKHIELNNNNINNNVNFLFDKSPNYTEIIEFQCERTENMSTKEYIDYNACRQHNFLTNGKKQFMTYLENILGTKNYPPELKELNNIELIAFILKEEIRKIITNSIKNKHPNKKLFILLQPLEIKDISNFCEEEIENLTTFFNDYQSNIFLVKEFKKKNNVNNHHDKRHNKNIKIKKDENGYTYIIVKKFCLIKDKEESLFLQSVKKKSELQVMNGLLILKDQYIQIRNSKNRKKNLTIDNKSYLSVKDWIKYLGIDNYYEYFLIKDHLHDFDLNNFKLIDIASRITKINKSANKKKLGEKFDEWIKLDDINKDIIKKEFENYLY